MKVKIVLLAMLAAGTIQQSENLAAENLLEGVLAASIDRSESLKSLAISGNFTIHRRNVDDKEDTLWTEGEFELIYDRGKYRLAITFRKDLKRTRYSGPAGMIEKVSDWAPTDVVTIANGESVIVATFSPRINPTGSRLEVFDSLKTAIARVGFPLRTPARPWMQVLDIEGVVKNLGQDAVSISRLKNGLVSGTYNYKNSKTSYVEFDVNPENGNNIVAKRVVRRSTLKPIATYQLAWKREDDIWFVEKYEASAEIQLTNVPTYVERTVVNFHSFIPNKSFDDSDFTVGVPSATRILDRRTQRQPAGIN